MAKKKAAAEHVHDENCQHDHVHDENCKHDHGHEEAARPAQTVSVEDAGPARKKIKIEVPAERIAAKLQENFDKLQEDAVLPGFRRGRAPLRLIQKRFGSSIREDVRMQIISESYGQAVEDNKLEVLGEPEIKDIDKIVLPENGPLSFEVEVEVAPVFELPSLEGVEVKKPKLEVTEADITKEIDNLRERMGTLSPAADGQVQPGDYLTANVVVRAGADANDEAELLAGDPQSTVFVPAAEGDGKGNIGGILVEGLRDKLVGKKVGDELRLSITGPKNHEDERIREQQVTIIAKIDLIARRELATIEKLVEVSGLETVEKLNERVKEVLTERNERQQQSAMQTQVAQWLESQVNLDLPEGITGRQSARLLRRRAMELAYQGVSEQEIQQRIAELRESSDEDARRQLKLFFIIDQAAKKLEIDVNESEINSRVALIAMQQGRRPEKLRQQMQRSGELEALYLSIREGKTLDKILESAKVIEVDASELEAEQAEKAKASKPKKKSTKAKKEEAAAE